MYDPDNAYYDEYDNYFSPDEDRLTSYFDTLDPELVVYDDEDYRELVDF